MPTLVPTPARPSTGAAPRQPTAVPIPPALTRTEHARATPMPIQRLLFLDWLRILAFGWLIAYHVGMYYVSWPWHVKSVAASTVLEPWMRLSSPWRMDLVFLVSGVASAAMLARSGATGHWLRQRSKRLLAPLLLGMLLIVPPQSWREVVQQYGYDGGYLEFLRLYLSAYGGFCRGAGSCLILPTWNHLWYLAYLATYTALAWLVLRTAPGLLPRLGTWLAQPRGAAWRLLVLPIAWLGLARLLLQARFPDTHALVDDWNVHAHHGAAFLAGLLFASHPSIWQRFERWRWPALLAAGAAWATLALQTPPWGEPTLLPRAWRVLPFVLQQWLAIVAAIGFARRHLDRDGPLRRQLGESVFPIYLLHQTLIILLAAALAPLALPAAGEAALLLALTATIGWLGYLVLRHRPALRLWFGLTPVGARAARSQAG